MNLQDFACAVSGLIWGGELGWDKEDGLEDLFKQVKKHIKQNREQKSKLNVWLGRWFIKGKGEKPMKHRLVKQLKAENKMLRAKMRTMTGKKEDNNCH